MDIAESLSESLKLHVIIVEYPGYGVYHSAKPSEEWICNDSLFVYDFLTGEMNFKPNNILVFGWSLGSVPAIFLSNWREI